MGTAMSRGATPMDENLLLFGGALVLAVAGGVMAAYVDIVWILMAAGIIIAAALITSRAAMLWFVVISGLILIGVAQMYWPAAKYLKYLPPLAASGLLPHVAADWLAVRRPNVPSTVPAFLSFLVLGVLSMAVNWQSIGMIAIGLKSYFPMWSLFLGLALIRWRPTLIDSLPKAMLVIAVLQFPFVAHQFLYLVPVRAAAQLPGVVPVDIVAGTFGGALYGGGANAVLSLFLIIVCACLLGMWRQAGLSGPMAITSVAVLLIPVMLNSSKVALLYLPIVFVAIFYKDIVRQPLKVFMGALLVAALVLAMLASFTLLSRSPETRTWEGLLQQTYRQQLAPVQDRAELYSGLSRWTVLTFWAQEHRRLDPVELLIGHGPGATRVQPDGLDLAQTLAERRYGGLTIGYTAVAALLWEVGVLGLAAVLWIFWLALRQAGRLAEYYADRDRVKSGIACGLRASVVILALSLAHKDFFVFHVPFQTLLMLVLGYLAAQTNFMKQEQSTLDPSLP
jgi:hypothetical protein